MKKFMLDVFCLMSLCVTISAMHHEEIPTARATAMKDNHQLHDSTPVQAKAEFINKNYTQAKAEAIPHATAVQSHTNLPTSTHSVSTNSLSIEPEIIQDHHDQPIQIFNAQGEILSEHFATSDGSQHSTVYNADGSTTTTVIDPKKIKQKETVVHTDGSSIIKFYNESGKLEGTDTKTKDGSKFSVKNSLEGDITDSAIINKTNQLEATMRLDDYGNRTATTYHADNTTTTQLFTSEQTTLNDDGTTTTQSTNPQGVTTQIIKNSDNNVVEKITFNAQQTKSEIIQYNPLQPGTIISTLNAERFPDGSIHATKKNGQNVIIEQTTYTPDNIQEKTVYKPDKSKEITKINADDIVTEKTIIKADGSKEMFFYNPETSKIVSKINSDTQGNATMQEYDLITNQLIFVTDAIVDKSGYTTSIKKDAQGKVVSQTIANHEGGIIFESDFKTDGTIETKEYDPTTDAIISHTVTTTDAQGNKVFTKKNNVGKIIETGTSRVDGSSEFTDYDEHEKPVSKTAFAADGTSVITAM